MSKKKTKEKKPNEPQTGVVEMDQSTKDFIPNSSQKNKGSKYYGE